MLRARLSPSAETDAPISVILQYLATRAAILCSTSLLTQQYYLPRLTHLGDTAVSRYYSRCAGACRRTGADWDRASGGGNAALAPWLGLGLYWKRYWYRAGIGKSLPAGSLRLRLYYLASAINDKPSQCSATGSIPCRCASQPR